MVKNTEVKPYQFFMRFGEEEEEFSEETPETAVPNYSEVNEIIDEAKEKARIIIEQANLESDQIRKDSFDQAHLEGYEAGFKEGEEKAQEEHTAKLRENIQKFEDEILHTMEEIGIIKERIIEEHINDLKNISLTVAEKIIKTSLDSSEVIIKRMILSAADKLKKSQWAKIYISASDSTQKVRGDAALIRELGNLSDNIKIVAMEGEEEGTCIIELPDEIIDASVNTQIQNIRDILNNAKL